MGIEGLKPEHVRKAQFTSESGLLSVFGKAGARKKEQYAKEREEDASRAAELAEVEASRIKEAQDAEVSAKVTDEEREAPIDPDNPQIPQAD